MYEQSEYWRGVNNSKAREAWATLLASHTWDAFFTATPRSSSVRKFPLAILGQVRKCLLETPPLERAFIAAEEFRLGGWHSHGLAKWRVTSEILDAGIASNALGHRLSGIGWCTVGPARSIADVSSYLAKYVVKDNPWEWDIIGKSWKL